jgi:hypothetical protein
MNPLFIGVNHSQPDFSFGKEPFTTITLNHKGSIDAHENGEMMVGNVSIFYICSEEQ